MALKTTNSKESLQRHSILSVKVVQEQSVPLKLFRVKSGKIFGALFKKKCPFWPISNAALNF